MTTAETAGEGLLSELRWVHDMLRRDLAMLRQLALDVSAGMAAADAQTVLDELQTRGPLWQLRVNCLQYCAHVHGHHGAESAILFPSIREESIGPMLPTWRLRRHQR